MPARRAQTSSPSGAASDTPTGPERDGNASPLPSPRRRGVGGEVSLRLADLRARVLAAAQDASAMGLMTLTSGNFSARDPESALIAITPSGRRYDTMTVADIVLVQLDGKVVDGSLKPSSETPL